MKKFFAVVLLAIGMLSFQSISADGSGEPPKIVSELPDAVIEVKEGACAQVMFQFAPAGGVTIQMFYRGNPITPTWLDNLNATLTVNSGYVIFTMNPALVGDYPISFRLSNSWGMVDVTTVIKVIPCP